MTPKPRNPKHYMNLGPQPIPKPKNHTLKKLLKTYQVQFLTSSKSMKTSFDQFLVNFESMQTGQVWCLDSNLDLNPAINLESTNINKNSPSQTLQPMYVCLCMIIIDLWFMMNKITFPKCEVGLGYHLILECSHIGALLYTKIMKHTLKLLENPLVCFEGHIWSSSFFML